MIESVGQRAINEILNYDNFVRYVIPKFQREFVWTNLQCEQLLNDILDDDKGHFLGSIILINKSKDALNIAPLEVIDGQQRITVISLIYAVIYGELKKINKIGDDEFTANVFNLKNRLIKKMDKNVATLELSSQNHNDEDYKWILQTLGILTDAKQLPYCGIRKIAKTYNFIQRKINDYSYEKLIDLLNRLNAATVVKIEVNKHSDAFILFESLNNRGIPLSPIDIIKNKILAEFESKNAGIINEKFQEWVSIIERLPDYTVQERFLRQYYNCFRYDDKIKVEGCSKATRSNLIHIYETLIQNDVDGLFEDIKLKSEVYNKFIKEEDGSEDEIANLYSDLQRIGAAPSYLFLLYLMSEHKFQDKDLQKVLDFLVKYFTRRNLTDFPNTRNLDRIFMDLVDKCSSHPDDVNPDFIIDYLKQTDNFAPMDDFKNKLNGDIYEDNVEMARFILCKIESEHQTKEIYSDLWKRNEGLKYIWTIEHVFPEGENIPAEWEAMVASEFVGAERTKQAKIIQEKCVHKLGNLTLTGYNQNLSNYSLVIKRDRKDSKGRFIGYKNGLFLNEKLKDATKWTADEIVDRTKELVGLAVNLFTVDGEKENNA